VEGYGLRAEREEYMIQIHSQLLIDQIKRIGIIAKDGWNLQLSTAQAKTGKFFQALCMAPDETVQTVVNMPLEDNQPDFAATIKSNEFVIADGIAALSKSDINIAAKGSKLVYSNDMSTIAVDMVEAEIKRVAINMQYCKYSLEMDRTELLEILKHAIRYLNDDISPNVILHVKERSITASGTNRNAVGYAMADCVTRHGAKWDEACASYEPASPKEAPGCDTAVPGKFVLFLISALSLSKVNRVSLIVDNKYLHLRYDGYSIISVRLSERIIKLNMFWNVVETPAEECFAVEKSCFEAAVKLICRRLEINRALSANVGIHLTIHKKALEVSVAANKVQVPIVESSGKVFYDMYVTPAYLMTAIEACKTGNILIKKSAACENGFICANGTVKDGFSAKSSRTLFMMLDANVAKQSEARFASGIGTAKEDAKKEN